MGLLRFSVPLRDYAARMNDAAKQPPQTLRRLISVALLAWLVVLILGPLSNPVGSEHLTKPLAKKVSPLHRLLFLGHGYRFFAPDPGPSHLVEFEITRADGSTDKGMFPDPEGPLSVPRLNYHRWFMLSETIWSEHRLTPQKTEFGSQQKKLQQLASEKQIAGNLDTAAAIRKEVEKAKAEYVRTRERIDILVRQVAKGLLQIHGGESIKLTLRERLIPYPVDVRDGAKLTDEKYLAPDRPPVIGNFTSSELGLSEAAEKPKNRKMESDPINQAGDAS